MTFFQELLRVRKRVIFRKPKRCVGACEFGKGGRILIAMKAKRVSPAQIYLHELIHEVRQSWSETQVLAMERWMWPRLTPHQRYLLSRKLFRHPYSTEEGEE